MSTRSFTIDGAEVALEAVQQRGNQVSFMLQGTEYHFTLHRTASGAVLLEQQTAPGIWRRHAVATRNAGAHHLRIQLDNREVLVQEIHAHQTTSTPSSRSPHAPMPGLVRQLLVKTGDVVTAGQPVVVMEAMKLQMTLNAGADGVVASIPVKEGDMVAEGALLVEVGDAK
jgi:acetyl/propionyl-CoA carboxylase alpha subunit